MILLKTRGNKFPDIWEKDGIAPFNSYYTGKEIFDAKLALPVMAIGFYSGEQSNKHISLLMLNEINEKHDSANDIEIKFRFLDKINIKSDDFDKEVSQIDHRLLANVDDNTLIDIFSNFGIPFPIKQNTIQLNCGCFPKTMPILL
jgi:hypothetical protein